MTVPQPTLTTPRLGLRPFVAGDAADVQRLAGAWEVADTTLRLPHPYEDGMAEAWISGQALAYARGEGTVYAITDGASGTLFGAIALALQPRFRRGELGYWIGVPYWGHGYATEAGHAVVRYGFTVLNLNRICATHFPRNPASGRVLNKLGMQREGVRRQHFIRWDRFEDAVVYGILRQEWGQP